MFFSIGRWGYKPDQAAAANIPDRLLHYSTALSILGSNYRMREHRKEAINKRLLPKIDRQ